MYVTSLTYDFGALEEGIASSLTIWTRIALDNDSWLSFSVANFGWVSGGSIKEYMLWFSALRYFYAGLFLFVDKYWMKSESIA